MMIEFRKFNRDVVYVRFVDNRGRLSLWSEIIDDRKGDFKEKCREMVRNGEIMEFLGFGFYGFVSVEGWIWVKSDMYKGKFF